MGEYRQATPRESKPQQTQSEKIALTKSGSTPRHKRTGQLAAFTSSIDPPRTDSKGCSSPAASGPHPVPPPAPRRALSTPPASKLLTAPPPGSYHWSHTCFHDSPTFSTSAHHGGPNQYGTPPGGHIQFDRFPSLILIRPKNHQEWIVTDQPMAANLPAPSATQPLNSHQNTRVPTYLLCL